MRTKTVVKNKTNSGKNKVTSLGFKDVGHLDRELNILYRPGQFLVVMSDSPTYFANSAQSNRT